MSRVRRRRTRLWVVWALRDARRRWIQVASIALLLALGTGMYAALSSLAVWRRQSTEESFALQRTHDLRLSLAEGSYVPAGKLRHTLVGLPGADGVIAADERLVVATQVDASTDAETIIVPGRIVGAPVPGGVDRLALKRGRALRPADDGRPVAQLEYTFAKHHELPAGGSLTLSGGRRLRYVGQSQQPEYFVVTAPGGDFGAAAAYAVVFVPLRTAQELVGRRARVNELVIRVRASTDVAALQAELAAALRRELPGTGVEFTRRADEVSHRVLYKDAEGDQKIYDVFAFLLLGAGAFAAFNLASRVVEAQRREIGIGMAIGVEPKALALRPLLLGAQISLLGVALGVPAGLAAGAWLRSVLETWFPMPVLDTAFQPGMFARGALVGFSLPLLATAIPVWRALRVAPVDAIRVGARSAKSSGLAWMARGIRIPGGSLSNLPLRNVLRTPRRTLMTALGIGAVVAIVMSFGGMLNSFTGALDASREEAGAGASGRLTVDLREPVPVGSPALTGIAAARSVAAAEPSLRVATTLVSGRDSVEAFTEVLNPAGRLWSPSVGSGALRAGEPGIAIARRAADDLGLRLGHMVTVRHPVRTGPSSFELRDTRVPVVAIHRSPLRYVVYATAAAGRQMQLTGLANRVSVVPAAGSGPDDVKRELSRLPEVGAVQEATAATDAVKDLISQFTDVLLVMEGIAIAMALLLAFNASSINADERVREHATMFAYGVTPARVLRGNVGEALLIGALGTALGMLLGYALVGWEVNVLARETMPDFGMVVSVEPLSYLTAAVTGTLAVAAAPLFTVRRLRRADIPSALRVVE